MAYFTNLVPRESPIVLGHVDTQENNFLVSLKDNEKMILIDYEYCDWNPMANDLADYINECICDNNALDTPYDWGIKGYPNNLPTKPEIEHLATEYLRLYHSQLINSNSNEKDFEEYLKGRLPSFVKEI